MNYLFFDIECANGGAGTICSFGYVITDSSFKILKREDIIINPEGRFYLTGRAGRPDVLLAYPKETFFRSPTFPKFHSKLKALLENEKYYIIGHSIGDDAVYLNKACARYNLEPFSFRYIDTQRIFREVMGVPRPQSVENSLQALGIDERFRFHQSVEDARATMFILKALLERAGMGLEEYIASTDRVTGKTEGGTASWDYVPPSRERTRLECDNTMRRGGKNYKAFRDYVKKGEAIGERSDKLSGRKVCISMDYEYEHFAEMLILVGMIKAAGGEYELQASNADLFATFEAGDESGTPRNCTRLEYVKAAIESGKEVEILTLDELLDLLGTSLGELAVLAGTDAEDDAETEVEDGGESEYVESVSLTEADGREKVLV